MKQTVTLNGCTFEYDLQRKKIKNINLRIRGNGTMYLSVNPAVSQAQIESFFRKKQEAIWRTLKRFETHITDRAKPHQYEVGEVFGRLDASLPLMIVQGKGSGAFVQNEQLVCTVASHASLKNAAKIASILKAWQKEQLAIVLEPICKEVYLQFAPMGVTYPEIKMRDMAACWGNCHPTKGVLTFNIWLVEAPLSCIQYVVVHEFVHFIHPNHSKGFYQLLTTMVPDWRQQKEQLNAIVPRMCFATSKETF